MSEHVIRRGARYYYRRRVPQDLIPFLDGKTEITRALGTSDPKEAARLARIKAVEIDSMFDQLRTRELQGMAQGTGEGVDGHSVDEDVEEGLRQARMTYEADQREIGAREEMEEQLSRIFAKTFLSAPVARVQPLQPAAVAAPIPDKGASSKGWPEAVRLWEEERKPSGATVATMHRAVGRFLDATSNPAIQRVERDHVLKFRKSMQDAGMSESSIQVYVSMIKAVMSVSLDAGIIKSNPAQGIRTEVTRSPRTARLPFTMEELQTIAAKLPNKGHDKWIPLLAMFSGARLEELGQLSPGDIKSERYRDAAGEQRTVPVVYITDEGEGQGVKNSASVRRVPVHPFLIECGFMEYAKSQKGARIFPDLVPDKYGRETANFSRSFGKFLRETCGIENKRKTFHSFRHTFKDILREESVEEPVNDALTGHTSGTTARDYGGQFYPLRPLVEAMDKFRIHGLKLKR